MATGRQLVRLGYEDGGPSAAFSTDGLKIVTASRKTARIYDIHWLTQYHGRELIKVACREKLAEDRYLTAQDTAASPMLSGREGEDV